MKIGIIGAMEEEIEIFRSKLQDRKVEEVAGCEFSMGTIGEQDVVLLKSGIGKVNAAMSTSILLDRYQPDCIINTGSASGVHHSLNVGDVVISTEVRHHDVDATAFDYEWGQVPQMPVAYLPDEKLVELAVKNAKEEKDIQVVKGLIATGDSFMSDADRVEFVRLRISDIYAVEMEAAAVAQVCYNYKVPFVIVRALSDIAGKEADISFDSFLHTAALHSTNLIMKMLQDLK